MTASYNVQHCDKDGKWGQAGKDATASATATSGGGEHHIFGFDLQPSDSPGFVGAVQATLNKLREQLRALLTAQIEKDNAGCKTFRYVNPG